MTFEDREHANRYVNLLKRMGVQDCYHQTLAYLFSLCGDCYNNIDMLYDFKEHCIQPESISAAWQTGTSSKVTRLAFNLFNGYCWKQDENLGAGRISTGLCVDGNCAPDNIFCCSYAPYFWEAIKLRYPEYCT